MEGLLLTDDEVVAVAADEADSWPVDLPTVDTRAATALREAVWRGRRSLAVRGMVGPRAEGAVEDELLASVRRDAVGARVLLGLHVGEAVSAGGTASLVVNAFPSGADWLVETVSDHGVHGFQHLDHETVVTLVAGLAAQALERGVAGTGRLWIGVVAEGRQPTLRVGAGRASVVDVEHGHTLPRTARPVTDVRAEVARLAADVHRLAAVSSAVAAGS